MRESKFISDNKDKWQSYEDGIRNGSLPAEKMEQAFVELNEDLAYARTFYKNRAVRLFLNNLLAPLYNRIYQVKRWNFAGIGRFFSHEAPLMNFQARRFMLVSLLFVIAGFATGYVSSEKSPRFLSAILGPGYVKMTEHNIAAGDPLAVYKYESPGDMFVSIAGNNLKVATNMFIFGALFCVGAIYMLFINGLILGAFTWMFVSKGLAAQYALGVYQHGTLEIMSMVVEGAAGIMLGAGFLFPGTKSRIRSVQDAAKKSIMMLLVSMPIIILAAFIESFLTRFTEIPDALRILVIALSFILMLGYFVILPWYKFRNQKIILGKYDNLPTPEKSAFEPGTVYPVGKTMLFSLEFLKRNFRYFLVIAVFNLLVVFPLGNRLTNNAITEEIEQFHRQLSPDVLQNRDKNGTSAKTNVAVFTYQYVLGFGVQSVRYQHSQEFNPRIFIPSWLMLFVLWFFVLYLNQSFTQQTSQVKSGQLKVLLVSLIISGLQVALNRAFGNLWWIAMIAGIPVLTMLAVNLLTQKTRNIAKSYGNLVMSVVVSPVHFFISMVVSAVLVILGVLGSCMFLLYIISQTAGLHGVQIFDSAALQFFARMNFILFPLLLIVTMAFAYYNALSLLEKATGMVLKRKIQGFKFKKVVYGIETES